MELKVGDICKHFKGMDLYEKNIYEIIAVDVKYTGNKENVSNLIVYKNIFQENMYFAREQSDLCEELSLENQKQYGQTHRIDLLTNDEKNIIYTDEFFIKKTEYMEQKFLQRQL